MAVAYGTTVSATPATGSTFTSGSWSTSGSTHAILIAVALETGTATVSSVSWSLGSGTAYKLENVQVSGSGPPARAPPNLP
jgi:hypothetical protein